MIGKEFFILAIGRLLQVIISLIGIKVATKYLEPIEMGNYYLIMSMIGFYGFFLINPVGQYINRHTHRWYEEKKIINIFFVFNFYVILISCASFFVTWVFYKAGVGNSIDMFYFLLLMPLYIFFNTWNQTIIPMINLLGNQTFFMLFTIFTQIFGLVSSVYFINHWINQGVFWIFGQVVGFGVVAIFSLLYFIIKIQNNFSMRSSLNMINYINIMHVFKFSAPLFFGIVFLWMQTQSYGIIIEKYIGAKFLGYFGIGISIAFTIFGSFEILISQYFYPIMYKSMKDECSFKITINIILNLVIPIYLLLVFFISFLSPYVVKVLVDAKYYDSYIYIIFGAWISFFRVSANMIANIAHAKLRTEKLIIPYCVGGVLSVACVLIAIHFDNYNMLIPIALLFAGFAGAFTMYIKMNNIIPIKLNYKIFLIVFLYSIPLFISTYFYNFAYQLKYSIIILVIYGRYFLSILYVITKGKTAVD